MTIPERIKNLRKALGLTVKELAVSLDIPVRTIGAYERGENPPNERFLSQLVLIHNVNINWLLVNRGNMFLENENIVTLINTNYNIPEATAKEIVKLIENENTREFVLRFLKAKNGDKKALDMLAQNIAGMKVAFS